MGTPRRYLKAYVEDDEQGRLSVLRFPPGVTLEDVGFQMPIAFVPTLPLDVLDRLSGIGVDVVATAGWDEAHEALRGVATPASSLGAFAEDYLDANARLGGERCVSVHEYAMDTWLGNWPLRYALRDCLDRREDVRMYGDAAFRKREVPDVLRLRARDIVSRVLSRQRRLFVPCRLHGDGCSGYRGDILPPDDTSVAVKEAVNPFGEGARVAVPRRLLDDLRGRSWLDALRAAREIMRLLLGALPEGAWKDDGWRPPLFDAVVAAVAAETCEEFKMFLGALRECRSAREVVQRARDTSWVVSRALENLVDRW